MASNVVRATLLADAQRFKAGFKEAEATTTGFEKRASGVATAVKGFLALQAVSAVRAFADDSKRAFSDLEQSTGSVESIFGSAADTIISKSKAAASQFGLSASEFQQSSALIGAQLKNNLGLSADEAAVKVQELIGRASDMAATFGGTTSEAIQAIGSLMRGERDPIERYGVSMNEAAVQARALEMGLADSSGELTTQAKGAAALDLLYKQTADSAGQFGREADTLAGKEQRLNAQLENNKALVGEAIQGAYKLAMPVVGAFSDVLADLSVAFMELTGAMSAADATLRNISAGWDAGTTSSEKFDDALAGAVTEMGHWVNAAINGEERQAAFVDETSNLISQLGLETSELQSLIPQVDAIAAKHEFGAETTDLLTEAVNRAIIRQKQQEDQLAENQLRMEAMTGATDDEAGAQDDLAGETKTATDRMRAQFDLIDGRLDTFGNLVEATRNQAAAQRAVNEAIKKHGEDSPEHLAALEDLAGANRDLRDAEIGVVEAGGMTRDEFIKQQVQMGLAFDDAQRLADKYDELFTPRTVTHTIRYHEVVESDSSGRTHSGGRQHGGPVHGGQPVVVGETQPEVFVPATAGTIKPEVPAGSPAAAGGLTINVNAGTIVSERELEQVIVDALIRYERRNGRVA